MEEKHAKETYIYDSTTTTQSLFGVGTASNDQNNIDDIANDVTINCCCCVLYACTGATNKELF